MADFSNLQWQLIAKDAASAAYNSVVEAQKKLTASSKESAAAVQQSTSSWKEVFKGVAGWDLVKKAVEEAKTAIVEFGKAGLEEQASQARSQSMLASAGISYKSVSSAVKEYSSAMVNLGFMNNEAEQSFSRLMVLTKNAGDAQKLGALAADLAADKQISLSEATQVLSTVFAGNTRVLKAYGVDLDDTATAAEAFAALQEKVGGRAQDMAKTGEGAVNTLKAKWDEFVGEISTAVVPAIASVSNTLSSQTDKIKEHTATVSVLQKTIYWATNEIKLFGLIVWAAAKTIVNFGLTVGGMVKIAVIAFGELYKAVNDVGANISTLVQAVKKAVSGDFAGAFDVLKNRAGTAFSATSDAFKDFSAVSEQLGKDTADVWSKVGQTLQEGEVQKGLKDITSEADKASKAAKVSYTGIGGANKQAAKDAEEARKKITDALKDIGADYGKASTIAREALASLESEHSKATAVITEKIKDLKKQLSELKTEYDKTVGGFNKTEAEGIARQEKKIADLTEQLTKARNDLSAGSGSLENVNDLEKQLKTEQDAYDKYMKGVSGLDTELKDARRRANETDFEREMEDLATKRKEEEAAYTDKKTKLDAQLQQEKDNQLQEDLVYQAKRQGYLDTMAALTTFHDNYTATLKDMSLQTTATVNTMKNKLAEVTSLIQSIESARAKAALLNGETGGGLANTSSGYESTVKATAGAGSTININMGGVVIGNEADENRLIEKMKKELMRSLQLAPLGSQ